METGYIILSTTTRSTLLTPSKAALLRVVTGFGRRPSPLFFGMPKLFIEFPKLFDVFPKLPEEFPKLLLMEPKLSEIVPKSSEVPKLSPANADARSPEDAKAAAARRFAT